MCRWLLSGALLRLLWSQICTFITHHYLKLAKKADDRANYPKVYLYRRIVQSKLYIDNHYSEEIDLENIAGEAHFSRFHFIRLFSKIYHYTPHQYLAAVRIERAKELLKDNMPVSDVCYSVGFSSVSSFTGLFKRNTGLTPSSFQQQYQQLRLAIKKDPLKFVPHCFAEARGWTKNSNFEEV